MLCWYWRGSYRVPPCAIPREPGSGQDLHATPDVGWTAAPALSRAKWSICTVLHHLFMGTRCRAKAPYDCLNPCWQRLTSPLADAYPYLLTFCIELQQRET